MKGIARTQKEIEFHDRVAQLGCISCRQEGNYNPWVSIHHAHGRTKPGCHMWVLPLCEPHHQDNGTAIARHPYKRRWEAKYGNEDDLIRAMWTELGVEFTEPVRVAKPVDRDRPKRATSESAEVGVVRLKEIKPKVDKPARAKIPSPAKPKAKIKGVGLINRMNKGSEKNGATKKTKPLKGKWPAASEDYKSKMKSIAKARRLEYLENNKEYIVEMKNAAKEIRRNKAKEYRERMS